MVRPSISAGLFHILMDFMRGRKIVVDINGIQTNAVDLPIGCVQVSTLGPRLFTIYCVGIADALSVDHYACYADDSYVVIIENDLETAIKRVEN